MLLIQRIESDVITAGKYQIWGFTFGILLPQFLQWKETWYQCKECLFALQQFTVILMMKYMHLLMTLTSKKL